MVLNPRPRFYSHVPQSTHIYDGFLAGGTKKGVMGAGLFV
jgi:hypothetical protein